MSEARISYMTVSDLSSERSYGNCSIFSNGMSSSVTFNKEDLDKIKQVCWDAFERERKAHIKALEAMQKPVLTYEPDKKVIEHDGEVIDAEAVEPPSAPSPTAADEDGIDIPF